MRIITSIDHRLAYWTGAGWSFIVACAAVFASLDDAMRAIQNHAGEFAWSKAHIVQ